MYGPSPLRFAKRSNSPFLGLKYVCVIINEIWCIGVLMEKALEPKMSLES